MATLTTRPDSPYWILYYRIGAKRHRIPTGIRHEGKRTPPETAKEILRNHEDKMARQRFGLAMPIEVKGLKDFYDEMIAFWKTNISEETVIRRQSMVNVFLKWAEEHGYKTLSDITPAIAMKYITEAGEKKASRTVKEEAKFHRQCFDEAKKRGHVQFEPDCNPWKIKIKVEKAAKVPFTSDQIKAMLACEFTDCPWMKTAIRIGLYTGTRIGSLKHLRAEHLALDFDVINFPDSKTGSYSVAMHPKLKEYLKGLGMKPGEFVLPLRARQGSHSYLSGQFVCLLKKHACIDGHYHMFRHTFTTLLAKNGVEKRIAMALANHLNEDVHDGYVHIEAASLLPHLAAVNFE